MYFGYSDDERILGDAISELFRRHAPISEVRKVIDTPVVSAELHNAIGEQGLLGVLAHNGSVYENVLMANAVLEQAGRALLPFPLVEGIIAAYFLSKDEAKASLYEQTVAGDQLVTIAWHAHDATRLEKTDGNWLANGSFYAAPFAASADKIMAFFQGPEPETKTLVILDRNDPAVSVIAEKCMDLSMPLDRVEVVNLTVTDDDILIGVGKGEELWQEAMQLGALFTAAELSGLSDEALKNTVEYTKIRKQFGQEIGKFQALKHMAAEMFVLAESTRVAVIYAAWALEAGTEPEAVSIAKAYASDAANEITGQAIQMHGGIGYTWESDLHLYFKRARRSSSAFGDAYAHREKLLDAITRSSKGG
ncbi:acyl-CoA dehydrogenase family protein [Hoeflea sp.]|uniref:acyl-CoA dehydrogenase family protein n=1 Tax=Hoeflea sp. TaxID=1940281 RepID=UPI003A9505B6